MRNIGALNKKALNIDFMVFMAQELEELLKKIIKVKLLLSLKKPQNTNKQKTVHPSGFLPAVTNA